MLAGTAETPGDGRGLHEAYAIFAGRSTGESRWPSRELPLRGIKASGLQSTEGAVDAIVRTTRSMLRSYGTHL